MVDDEFETNRAFSDRRDQYSLIKLSHASVAHLVDIKENEIQELDKSESVEAEINVYSEESQNGTIEIIEENAVDFNATTDKLNLKVDKGTKIGIHKCEVSKEKEVTRLDYLKEFVFYVYDG